MGSYLSIVNNTDAEWYCRIGADEKALMISKYVGIAVGAAALVIGTAGAAAPAVASLSAGGVISVAGISTSALATITGAAAAATGMTAAAGTASLFSVSVVLGIESALKKEGFVRIPPGETHRWGKMTLSLWQQGTCVSTTIIDAGHVQTDTLLMRPIFSGQTDGDDQKHKIQWWITKSGTTKNIIEADPTAAVPSVPKPFQ